MANEIILLEAKPYNMKDRDTGATVAGINIKYTIGDVVMTEREIGLVIFDDRLPYSALPNLEVVPGWYETVDQEVSQKDAKGKMQRVTKLLDVKFIAALGLIRMGADGKPLNGKSQDKQDQVPAGAAR